MGRKRKNKWKTKIKKYATGILIVFILAVLCMAYGISDINEVTNSISNTAKTITDKISDTWNDEEDEEDDTIVTKAVSRNT